MSLNILAIILAILAYLGHRRAWRGVMSEPRSPVDAGDLIAAAIFLLCAAGLVTAFTLWTWRNGLAQEWLPIAAFAASGHALLATRSALGLPMNRT